MKTLLLLFTTLFTTVVTFAQGTETFSNVPNVVNAYQTFTWTGDNGLPWNATDARTDTTLDGSKAVTVRVGAVTCNSIPNGCTSLSFKYKQVFGGSNGKIVVRINGIAVDSFAVTTNTQIATINNINAAGNFNLDIRQVSSTPTLRVRIDDVMWTAFNTTPCVAPAAQPSGLTFGSPSTSSISGSFTAASPSVDEYIVLMSTSATLSALPQSGQTYYTDDVIGNATVISRNTTTSFNATGLNQGTTYYFYIFSINSGCTGGPLYNVTNPLTGTISTTSPPVCTAPSAAPGTITLTPANTTVSGSFAAVAGVDGYLSIVSTSSTFSFTPVNGTSYTAGQTVGSGTTGTIVKSDPGTSFFATGLTANTTYYFYVYSVNGFTCTGGPLYNTTPASASVTTSNGGTGEPAGYYTNTTNKSCNDLKSALKYIITNGHQPKTYGDLWTQYQVSDIKPREVGPGTSPQAIWDIYSDRPNAPDSFNFTPGANQCGSYVGEGDCYNREHSVPQSWFNGNTSVPGPTTDYFHIFPTDGKVNAMRSNYIYGEVATASYTSSNGSKLGTSSIAAFSTTTVFEPIDEYKGDLARAFLYFVTRYQDNIPGWSSTSGGLQVFTADTFPSVKIPYLQLMIKWATQDAVSQKERDRNNAGYAYQGNRNPYIDHPEYVNQVWNSNCTGLGTLPVSIISFYGKLINDQVVLSWIADNEVNFDLYEIERSFNGTSYTKIGSVKAENLRNYSFSDNADAIRGQRTYYRLKKVDRDGKFSYSAVFTLHIPRNTKFSVYPNPASGYIQLQMNKNVTGKANIQIVNALGKVMQQKTENVNGNVIMFLTNNISNGTYLVKLTYNGEQYTQKVIVAK